MMEYDELELEKLGEEKIALFAVVSDSDPTFNFISAMMYSQMFNVLCKDDVITFEELGVDKLFVDEAHGFKNLFLATKMRNVAGIGQSEAQKSSDMFAKCRYLDEITGGRGVVFATGTPVSNSMVELYTMMRYLQYDLLQSSGLEHFDSWAANFGETTTSLELAPEGTGFRSKTRFAKFFNLPELMAMWREAADIQTADMLRLPVPEAEKITEVTTPSDFQRDLVADLGERAEAVRNREVEPREDNMLKITSDGRKLALDQRLSDPTLPDDPESKVNVCVRNVLQVWRDTEEIKGTQLVFCDLSTPKGDGSFNVYDDMKQKLMAQGVPPEEIAFIHDAKTEAQKAELFAKVRKGQVRVLLGSTAKMGAGTNVQPALPHCTIWIAPGGLPTLSSARAVSCGKGISIRRSRSISTLQRIPLTHITGAFWRTSRNSSAS